MPQPICPNAAEHIHQTSAAGCLPDQGEEDKGENKSAL